MAVPSLALHSIYFWHFCHVAFFVVAAKPVTGCVLLCAWQPLDEGLVLNILRQCADGLQHIHASKLVHRDVRADNFLVASRDPLRMIITDFGLSHKLHDIDGAWRSFSETLVGPVGACCKLCLI